MSSTIQRPLFRKIFVFLIIVMMVWYKPAATVQATNVIDNDSCNPTDVSNALSSGGTTDFIVDCTVILSATIVISNDTIINGNGNDVVLSGGDSIRVLHVTAGIVEINGLTITEGYTYQSAEGGGAGLRHSGGTVTINDTTFFDNFADSWDTGGAILQIGAGDFSLTINRSAFYNNRGDYAGAIATSKLLTINNSTISGNTAEAVFGYGTGGIWSTGDTIIRNSTITNNNGQRSPTLPGFGGGGVTADGDTFSIQNSIISGNNLAGGPDHDCNNVSVSIVSEGYNLVGQNNNAHGCPANAVGDMVLGGATNTAIDSLADNGGPTLTHALTLGSPAIDAIDDGLSDCAGGISMDQRGAVRADGPNRGGPACDIGAYEFASSETPTSILLLHLQTVQHDNGGWVFFLLVLGLLTFCVIAGAYTGSKPQKSERLL